MNYGFSLEENNITLKKIDGKLGDYAKFSLGVKTSDDKKFILDYKKDINSFKMLRGKDIGRFFSNFNSKFIWYKPELMLLKKGAGVRKKDYFLSDKKILIKDIAKNIQATLDDEKYFTNDTINIIYESTISMEFIVSLLNSKLINNWFNSNFQEGLHIKINQLTNIPIVLPLNEKLFIDIVNLILSNKQQNIDTKALENEIDVMVYKLYELTYDEVLVIDAGFGLSAQEYENYSIK